ncbi:flagellar FliL protein [Salirhabdus euzebyi]|uniref:Flagellar protein FliL n=1 Tax=Salirhabdus euzebyi TaxID=394506 RepID=A0A841Q3E3_9BACI|nr:flagellar basal body-associated FliL family protein [Salirhabdus euzebyi]MBB6452916.1 flagellar FliL protein [Salirhabdus euzebyi]
MNKKVLNVMLTLLVIITIAGVVAIIVIMNTKDKTHAEGERSLEEMIKDSFETEEITTDLKDGNYVRIKFRIVTDDKDTKEALEKDFRIQNIIIKELSLKEENDLRSGLTDVENTIKQRLNELINEGEVTDVYTTGKVLQ